MARLRQARSYDCAVKHWIDVAVYGHERYLNDNGHYGSRIYAGNNGQVFSYGSHFEMARVLTDKKGDARLILINGERASNTTTKHQGYVRNAVARTSIPSVIIPYGAIEAANIDIDSIKLLEAQPDKWLTIEHESVKPPRWAQWINAAEYEEGEWGDEEKTRWNDWHDWSKHVEAIDKARQLVEYGIDEWNKLMAGEEVGHPYWLKELPRTYRELMELEGTEPKDLGKPTGPTWVDAGNVYRPSPPKLLVPTGDRVQGYVHHHRLGIIEGVLEDGKRVRGVMPGRELHGPDADGVWRWSTQRHILGESLIVADVNATKRVTCPDCKGAGWDTTGKQPRLRNGLVWTGHREQEDWDKLMVREEISVPVPRTDVDVFQYPNYTEPRRSKMIAREYRWGRMWRTWTRPVMGALPMPPDAYACYGCHGAKKVTQQYKRRNVKFLSGFDHGEPHLAYFFCEMPKCDATTVDEAYEALKPDVVKLAEQMGRECVRQGDIFAIPTTATTKELMAEAKEHGVRHRGKAARLLKLEPAAHQIATGDNWSWRRLDKPVPLYREQALLDKKVAASMLLGTNHQGTEVIHGKDGTIYAKGCLWHVPDGRTNDHVRKKLGDGKTWHIIVKNTVPVRKA